MQIERFPKLSDLFAIRFRLCNQSKKELLGLCSRAGAYLAVLEHELDSSRRELNALHDAIGLSDILLRNVGYALAVRELASSNPELAKLLEAAERAQRASSARKAAAGRYDAPDTKDKKVLAKRDVRAYWDDWQQHPSRYKGNAAFARDMLDKFEVLRNQAVIEGWARSWKSGRSVRAR
jgi:hypothetical protein